MCQTLQYDNLYTNKYTRNVKLRSAAGGTVVLQKTEHGSLIH